MMSSQQRKAAASACRIVKASGSFKGKQGLDYLVGISAETAGSRGIHMQLVTIPPGAKARAHKHVNHETAIYALSGTSACFHGEGLKEHCVLKAGEFMYIPANVPHLPYNPSRTEKAVAVIARTDPNEQESVELLPELDAVAFAAADQDNT